MGIYTSFHPIILLFDRTYSEMKHKDSKNVTIADIAQAAGVSKTTVSRYLNGKYNMMSAETRTRIETVIRMSNYRPNSLAQSLRGRRSMQIGVVISDIANPFCASVIRSVGHTLLEDGYVSLVVDSKEDPELEQHLITTLLSRKVDGLIVNTSSFHNPSLIQIACGGTPVVLVDRYVQDYHFAFVGSTHREPIFQLIAHLKEEGYSKVAFFTPAYENVSSRFIRRRTYMEAMEQYFPGADPEKLTYRVELTDREHTVRCVRELLDSCGPGEVPAIFTANAATCMHLLGAVQTLGLSVPGDLGLCGPDDWGWDTQYSASILNCPSITSLAVHPDRMGTAAAKLMLQMLRDPEGQKSDVILPTALVLRDSTRLRAWREKNL